MTRILLLEPDQLLGESYRRALVHAGHTVDWQRGAQEAVHSLDANTAGLLIVELQLANHNGVEFLYELRSYPEWHDLPVIILSHVPKRQIMTNPTALEHINIADYLYKPTTDLGQLIAAVESALVKQV